MNKKMNQNNEQLPGPIFYFVAGIVWLLCAELLVYRFFMN